MNDQERANLIGACRKYRHICIGPTLYLQLIMDLELSRVITLLGDVAGFYSNGAGKLFGATIWLGELGVINGREDGYNIRVSDEIYVSASKTDNWSEEYPLEYFNEQGLRLKAFW